MANAVGILEVFGLTTAFVAADFVVATLTMVVNAVFRRST